MTPTIDLLLNGETQSLAQIGKLIAHEGWAMSPLHRLAARGAEQHGDTDEGFRLDPRLADLVFRLPASTLNDMYAYRDAAIQLFSPLGSPILRWTFDDGRVRQIACHYHSSLLGSWDADSWAAPKLAITLKASDPTFYDPVAVALTFAQGSAGNAFEVPTDIPTDIGSSELDETEAVTYSGTWRSYPHLIRIRGPIDEFVIANESTGAEIRAKTGVGISAGDYYDIDCRWDRATVTDSAGANVLGDLEDADDLTAFYLAPRPEVPNGLNVIRVAGTGTNENTRVDLTYFKFYLGL